MSSNPYEPPVRAELADRPRPRWRRIVRGMLLWWVAIASLGAVGVIGGAFGPIELAVCGLAALAVLLAGIYRLLL